MDDISRTRVTTQGSTWRSVRVRDVKSGQDMADELQGLKDGPLAWTRDARGFFYTRVDAARQAPASNPLAPDGRDRVYYHRLGRPQSDDRLMFETADHPSWRLRAVVSDDGQYLVISAQLWVRASKPIVPDRPRQPEAAEPRRANREAVRRRRRRLRFRRQQRTTVLHSDDEGRSSRVASSRSTSIRPTRITGRRSFARLTTR